MPPLRVPPRHAVPGSSRSACAIVLVLLGALPGGTRAEVLGTHPHPGGTVLLMTEPCRGRDPGAGQRARQTAGGRERHGCWDIDRAGNPVVTWSDGSELALDGDKVKLSRWMAGLLTDGTDVPVQRASARVAEPRAEAGTTGDSRTRPRSAAAMRDFERPAWCPDARFPHERLVCSDAELAARDLHLASLWRPYRSTLSRVAVTQHKSDYFRRLKACGADRACIMVEQETQMHRYRNGPGAGG